MSGTIVKRCAYAPCRKEFTVDISNRRYCSVECAHGSVQEKERQRDRNRERRDRPATEKNCPICDKHFNSPRRYCSPMCSSVAKTLTSKQHGAITASRLKRERLRRFEATPAKKCASPWCNNTFKVFIPPNKKYCSDECQRKAGPRTRRFGANRTIVLARDTVCRACSTSEKLHVHHIIPREYGGRPTLENLITLCSHCHRKLEWMIRKRAIKWYFETHRKTQDLLGDFLI